MEKRNGAMIKDFFEELKFGKYLFLAVITFLLVLSYFVIRAYLIALVSAFILAYLTKPVYFRLSKKIGKRPAALSVVFFVLVILIVPVGLIFAEIVQQASHYLSSEESNNLLEKAENFPFLDKLVFEVKSFTGEGISYSPSFSILSSAFSFVFSMIVSLFIVFFGMYYVLVNWDELADNLKKYLPFKNKNAVANDLAKATNSIVYGTLFIGLIEFAVAAIGFYILGVRFYWLLSLIVFLSAFIPFIGPAIAWLPIFVYYLLIENYYVAGGVFVLGIILSVVVDTLIRIYFLGEKSRINPVVMLLGIFGGISVFGVFGFVIGPLILLYTIEILQEMISHE